MLDCSVPAANTLPVPLLFRVTPVIALAVKAVVVKVPVPVLVRFKVTNAASTTVPPRVRLALALSVTTNDVAPVVKAPPSVDAVAELPLSVTVN